MKIYRIFSILIVVLLCGVGVYFLDQKESGDNQLRVPLAVIEHPEPTSSAETKTEVNKSVELDIPEKEVSERAVIAAYSLFYRLDESKQSEWIGDYSSNDNAEEAILAFAKKIENDDNYLSLVESAVKSYDSHIGDSYGDISQLEDMDSRVNANTNVTPNSSTVPVVGAGSYYTDSLGMTSYYGNGINGKSYVDSLGITHYSDNTGYTATTYKNSLGTTTYSNTGNTIRGYSDTLGTSYYGSDGYYARSHTDTLSTTYRDNAGNSIRCYQNTLGTNCY